MSIERHEDAQKDRVGRAFDAAAGTYDRFGPPAFAAYGRRLVEVAGVDAGSQVLDVATGTGAVLVAAAERVGDDGSVVGADLSGEMVRETSGKVADLGLANARVVQMDAERLDFEDDTFDYVLCSFGIFFFPDYKRALADFHRIVRPGGKAGLNTFGENQAVRDMMELIEEYELENPFASQAALSTPEKLEGALREAGFDAVDMTVEESDWVFPSLEHLWRAQFSVGVRAALDQLSPEQIDSFKADLFARLQPFMRGDEVHLPRRVMYVVGTKPASTA
jgi:ubiquinone/menaquinone biosynthesis C-methylase UbiE